MPEADTLPSSPAPASRLSITQLMRPYWKALSIACIAVIGETLTDVLEPWPVKVVIDSVLQSKPLNGWVVDAVF